MISFRKLLGKKFQAPLVMAYMNRYEASNISLILSRIAPFFSPVSKIHFSSSDAKVLFLTLPFLFDY